jgi:hypothetical protein
MTELIDIDQYRVAVGLSWNLLDPDADGNPRKNYIDLAEGETFGLLLTSKGKRNYTYAFISDIDNKKTVIAAAWLAKAMQSHSSQPYALFYQVSDDKWCLFGGQNGVPLPNMDVLGTLDECISALSTAQTFRSQSQFSVYGPTHERLKQRYQDYDTSPFQYLVRKTKPVYAKPVSSIVNATNALRLLLVIVLAGFVIHTKWQVWFPEQSKVLPKIMHQVTSEERNKAKAEAVKQRFLSLMTSDPVTAKQCLERYLQLPRMSGTQLKSSQCSKDKLSATWKLTKNGNYQHLLSLIDQPKPKHFTLDLSKKLLTADYKINNIPHAWANSDLSELMPGNKFAQTISMLQQRAQASLASLSLAPAKPLSINYTLDKPVSALTPFTIGKLMMSGENYFILKELLDQLIDLNLPIIFTSINWKPSSTTTRWTMEFSYVLSN